MKFLQQFGTVTKTAWLHNLDKALVEFEMLESAENLIHFCQGSGTPITIDGKPASFAFSKSQKINTPSNKPYPPGGSQRILHCNIQDPRYIITVDVIRSIMDRFGTIQRIVIFQKSTLQVLVEFESAESARAALSLDGKDIYPDCCKLKIEFSRQERLNVHYNNSKQWDFTVSLPRGPEEAAVMPQMNPAAVDMQSWSARTQFMTPQFFGMMQMPMSGVAQQDVHAAMQPSQMYPTQQYPGMYRSQQQMVRQPPVAQPTEVPVVMINQLPTRINEQHMFNFASLYGVVEKVKNLGQGRMLCQMRNPAEAKQLIEALNTVSILRYHVRAEASRHASIRDGSGESSVDFSSSPFNRYKDGSSTQLPSKTILFSVRCACTVADIKAVLKAANSPDASDIVVDDIVTDGVVNEMTDDLDKSGSDSRSSPKTPDDDTTSSSSAAAASTTGSVNSKVTTGKILCANTGTAAEIVMMANNTLVCGNAPLELRFDS